MAKKTSQSNKVEDKLEYPDVPDSSKMKQFKVVEESGNFYNLPKKFNALLVLIIAATLVALIILKAL